MITMLTFISHMDIGENTSHLNTLKTPPATLFFYSSLCTPKKLPNNPKKNA